MRSAVHSTDGWTGQFVWCIPTWILSTLLKPLPPHCCKGILVAIWDYQEQIGTNWHFVVETHCYHAADEDLGGWNVLYSAVIDSATYVSVHNQFAQNWHGLVIWRLTKYHSRSKVLYVTSTLVVQRHSQWNSINDLIWMNLYSFKKHKNRVVCSNLYKNTATQTVKREHTQTIWLTRRLFIGTV